MAEYAGKRCLIGGNWKCNGTVKQVEQLTAMLNSAGEFPTSAEVVIATPAIHLARCKATFNGQIAVSAQDVGLNPGKVYIFRARSPPCKYLKQNRIRSIYGRDECSHAC